MIRTRCPHCKGKLEGRERIHEACIAPWADAQAQKAERRAAKASKAAQAEEKRQDRVKKEKLKSRSQWLAECQTIVNRYVRTIAQLRGEGCYTCGATPEQKFGGTYDASHFRSVGSAPHMRFWLPQIRICCTVCNRHKGGSLLVFRQKLVMEHGRSWVERLEARQEVAKWPIDYLKRFKAVMGKRLRRAEKRLDDRI